MVCVRVREASLFFFTECERSLSAFFRFPCSGTWNVDWDVFQEIHPRLQRHVKNRTQAMDSGKGLDWATAEVRARVYCAVYESSRACTFLTHAFAFGMLALSTRGLGPRVRVAHARRLRRPDIGAGRRPRNVQPEVSTSQLSPVEPFARGFAGWD